MNISNEIWDFHRTVKNVCKDALYSFESSIRGRNTPDWQSVCNLAADDGLMNPSPGVPGWNY